MRAAPGLAALALVLALGACSKGDNEPGPGGVTVGEARALDEAAQMIEGQSLPADAPAPQQAPAPQAPPAKPAEKSAQKAK